MAGAGVAEGADGADGAAAGVGCGLGGDDVGAELLHLSKHVWLRSVVIHEVRGCRDLPCPLVFQKYSYGRHRVMPSKQTSPSYIG